MRQDGYNKRVNNQVAETIAKYWLERGYQVSLRVGTVIDRTPEAIHCVRSNMVNGLPVARQPSPKRGAM